ncbi:MAG: AsnC family protein, partial [Paraburkholderia sp.]
MTAALDAYDYKLLAEVQSDARIPQNELGARVNLSTAAV